MRRPCGQPWGNPGEPAADTTGDAAVNQQERDRVKDEKITFCLCFIPARSPIKPTMRNMVLMAGRRWAAEEGNETGKGPIGWDENQLRKWGSLQKHTALAGLAMLRSNLIIDRAVSIDRSKSGRRTHGFLKQQLRKHFVWRPETQYSARPVVKRICNRLKIGHITGKFCPLRKVFPDKPVRILVSSALPRRMGVGEIYR